MSERDEVQSQGLCPSRRLPRQLGLTPQGVRNAVAEKTNEVFRRRLTCDSRLSAAAGVIVCAIQRGYDNEVAVETNLQVMSELKNRATQQFARVAM
ncbi:MAG: hypothetical protein CVU35_06450 [Betaproteobacteria bacterium HGW-Betaproteobacteria-8]|nr:MAG: hypothetical protein CVU35_06450 [Betaproteobacteria bacterium HGW-Betaproteobacteria-8]